MQIKMFKENEVMVWVVKCLISITVFLTALCIWGTEIIFT